MSTDPKEHRPSAFPPTRWSLIIDAKSAGENVAHEALSELCSLYWYPLYAYARRAGNSPEDAEDITQGFLSELLERGAFFTTDEKKGKLRSFLLASLKNHMRDEWRKGRREKRGGGDPAISIDLAVSEQRYAECLVDEMTPEVAYDRLWVLSLLEEVMKRLGEEYERKGHGDLIAMIGPYLGIDADDRCPFSEIAERFGVTESGARVMVHRLRKRYRELLCRYIADTLNDTDDFDVELDYLMGLFDQPHASRP